MGWLSIVCAVLAAVLFRVTGNVWLFWLAVASGVIAAWSYGVMHNYAMEAAKRSRGFTVQFYDITEQEADAVPNWIAALNMLSSIVAFILLIVAIVFSVT